MLYALVVLFAVADVPLSNFNLYASKVIRNEVSDNCIHEVCMI